MKGWKSLEDFIKEDSSLMNKYNYEQYQNGEAAPDNSDIPISEVFRDVREYLKKESAHD